MDNLLTLALEAHNDEHNHHRRYEIVVGRDLLDDWTGSVRYGRVGSGGQQQRFATKDTQDLHAIIRDKLKRRLTAERRIGCAYRLVELSVAGKIKNEARIWLPEDVITKFTAAQAMTPNDALVNH